MKRKAKGKKTRPDRLFMRFFLVVFVAVIAVCTGIQMQKYEDLQKEAAELSRQIAEEEQKLKDFEEKKEYYNSDEYIEQIAREKLGLVKSNEVLIINRKG